jgi:hypothetical protein
LSSWFGRASPAASSALIVQVLVLVKPNRGTHTNHDDNGGSYTQPHLVAGCSSSWPPLLVSSFSLTQDGRFNIGQMLFGNQIGRLAHNLQSASERKGSFKAVLSKPCLSVAGMLPSMYCSISLKL